MPHDKFAESPPINKLRHVICTVWAVLTWASGQLDPAIPLLADSEALDVVAEGFARIVVLARRDVHISDGLERAKTTFLHAHTNLAVRFLPCQPVGSLGFVGARASRLFNVHLSLLADFERLGILTEAVLVRVLPWGVL